MAALLAPDPPALVEGSFLDGEFRDRMTDRLYKARLRDGKDAFIYSLLEHKSKPFRKVAWQLHRYLTRILEQWERENPKWKKLPPIIAIVIYHGKSKWQISHEFQSLIAGNNALRPYLMNFRFVMVNLGQIDNALLSRSPRLRIGFLVLKYVFRKNEQRGIMKTVALLLREAPDLIYPVMLYIIHTYDYVDEPTIRELVRVAKPEEEAQMMSQFAQSILSKNPPAWVVDSVRQEGEAKALLRQLHRRFGELPDWVTARIKTANAELLEIWLDRILDAKTLENVFSD